MPPKQTKQAKEATIKNTVAFLQLAKAIRDDNHFRKWIRSDLFAPRFRTFYNDGYKVKWPLGAGNTRPSWAEILKLLQNTQGAGRVIFTEPEAHKNLRSWDGIQVYAWVVANIAALNSENPEGIFWERPFSIEKRWQMIYEAVRAVIRDQGASRKRTLLLKDYMDNAEGVSDAVAEQNSVEETEGVTFVWRNYLDLEHGNSGQTEDEIAPTDFKCNLTEGFADRQVWELRNEVREYFEFPPNIRMASTFVFAYNGDIDLSKIPFDEEWWQQFPKRLGDGYRLFVLFETVSEFHPTFEHALERETTESAFHNQLNTCFHAVDLEFNYDKYIVPSLDPLIDRFRDSNLFEIMRKEKETRIAAKALGRGEDISASDSSDDEDDNLSLYNRFDRYDMLVSLARLPADRTSLKDTTGWQNHSPIEVASDEPDLEEAVNLLKSSEIGDATFVAMTDEQKTAFADNQRLLDNTKFQREHVDEAVKLLGVRENDQVISNMSIAKPLKFWQTLGIAGILNIFIKGKHKCAFLADAIGLGKSVEVVGIIQWFMNTRGRLDKNGRGKDPYLGPSRPYLGIVPSSLIRHWVYHFNTYAPDIELHVYYSGYSKSSAPYGVRVYPGHHLLRSTDKLFNRTSKENSRIVVLTTPRYFSNKHGPQALAAWRRAERKRPESGVDIDDPAAWLELQTDWPAALRDCFCFVFVDEAQYLKGGVSTNIGVATHWLMSKHNRILYVAATPVADRAADIKGYFEISELENPWTPTTLDAVGINQETNVFKLANDHPAAFLRLTVHAITKWICDHRLSAEEVGAALERVYEPLLIRRTTASQIPFQDGKKISDEMPNKLLHHYSLRFTNEEHEEHREFHNNTLISLIKPNPLAGDEERIIHHADRLQELNLLALSTKLHYLTPEELRNVGKYMKDDAFDLSALATLICSCANSGDIQQLEPPPDEKLVSLLRWFAIGSPKLRFWSYLVADIVVKKKEKLLLLVQYPWQQLLLVVFFRAVCINVGSFHSDLDADQKSVLSAKFNSYDTQSWQPECMILISTYEVAAPGLSWQSHCRIVGKVEPPMSDAHGEHATRRVLRLGQSKDVLEISCGLEDTVNDRTIQNTAIKSLPELMALLDPETSPDDAGNDRERVSMKRKYSMLSLTTK